MPTQDVVPIGSVVSKFVWDSNLALRLQLALDLFAPWEYRGELRAFAALLRELPPEHCEILSVETVQGYFVGKGQPSIRWATDAARVLGVSPVWLIHGTGKAAEGEAFDKAVEEMHYMLMVVGAE